MIQNDEMYTTKRKPRKCPNCGSKRIANILYGLPPLVYDIQQEVDDERVVLRACCLKGPVPSWECLYCGIRLYRETEIVEPTLF